MAWLRTYNYISLQAIIRMLGSISSTCLCAAFTCADPKSAKDSQVKQLLALFGSARVKAGRKHVDDIDHSDDWDDTSNDDVNGRGFERCVVSYDRVIELQN